MDREPEPKGGAETEAPQGAPNPKPRVATQEDTPPVRWSVLAVALLHAVVFSGAALLLPWADYPLFGLLTALVAAGHLATAVAARARPRSLPRIWRISAFVALGWLALLTWGVATSALYMHRIYGALGTGIAVALLIGWCIPILFTVPLSAWALGSTRSGTMRKRPPGSRRRVQPQHGALLVGLLAISLLTWHKLAPAATERLQQPGTSPVELTRATREHMPRYDALAKARGRVPRLSVEAMRCERSITTDRVTLFVQFRANSGDRIRTVSRCLQAETPAAALELAAEQLRHGAVRAPIKLDWVTGTSPLASTDPLLDGFKLRPGLDGACHGDTCLLGWQLAARDMLNENAPLAAVPELRMGFSAARLRAALGLDPSPELEGVTRITTQSLLFTGQVDVLSRLHRDEQPLSKAAVEHARRDAEAHVVRALQRDGRFRYQLHPFEGNVDTDGYNLPRQAGTTLVLCDLGRSRQARPKIEAALEQMLSLEVRSGEKSVLVYPEQSTLAPLGNQALPLLAFLSCRDVVGPRYDKLVGRLALTLLAMQTPEGDFYPEWDLAHYTHQTGPPPLFSPGQAVMALVLLEGLVKRTRPPGWPPYARVREAADRAMQYYGNRYWDFPLGRLFYIEENWHCLAARAALAYHRVDAYEAFCIAHAEFKARFIVGAESPTRDMQGAFALAPLIPPPNTATAGVGEALAAAIALKRARNESTSRAEGQLERLMQFLLRQQWDQATCFACAKPKLVVGGFSDSMLTPTMRIDFTQHAWAALAYGGDVLGLLPAGKKG